MKRIPVPVMAVVVIGLLSPREVSANVLGICAHHWDLDKKIASCIEASKSTSYPWILQWVYRELARAYHCWTAETGNDGTKHGATFHVDSATMLAGRPAALGEKLLAVGHRLVLQRRAHGVVPPVEEAEHGDGGDDLDDLLLAPVLAQLFE